MDIDWSKAPPHATHWCPGNAKIEAGWIYNPGGNGGEFYSCYADKGLEHIPEFPEWRKSRLVPRPSKASWTGEGLPPVGTKVTIETNGLRIWKEAEVFIGRTSEVVATFKLIESDMVVVYLEEENACCVFRACMCRLPKTPEQLKAEDDARATSVLTGELEHLVLVSERLGPSELAEKLIRLNYRKQPTDQ